MLNCTEDSRSLGYLMSDLHTLHSGWGETMYPCVVGHEIVSTAVKVGSKAEGGIKSVSQLTVVCWH